jgi:ADP-heptose:LPS heptosyltransferase
MNATTGATSPVRLGRLLAQRYTPPFKHELPGSMAAMLENERLPQRLREHCKLLKRWLWLNLNLQSRLLQDRLPPPPARLLWLSPSSNSIGDSVMELSGRALLGAYEVDLLTDKFYAELYSRDRYFKRVFTNPEAIDPSRYDFCLQDFFNTRSIRIKRRVCPRLPFATLQGFFWGADYHRTLFSYFRINHLLGYPFSEDELRPMLRPHLFLEAEPSPSPRERGRRRVVMVIGGAHAARTYRKWPDVIRCLLTTWPPEQPFPEFTLVGSRNGLAFVEPVMAAFNPGKAKSFVGALSLRATARLISDCDFFLGPDGGLMHCAVSVDVPGVALFARLRPNLLLPPKTDMQPIYDPSNVNNIPPQEVAEAVRNRWAALEMASPG